MGNNKKALYLIIERLGDVNRVHLFDDSISLFGGSCLRRLLTLPRTRMMTTSGKTYSDIPRHDLASMITHRQFE